MMKKALDGRGACADLIQFYRINDIYRPGKSGYKYKNYCG